MSTPWAQTAVLTSSSQFSAGIGLDPLAKMTAVQVTFSATPPSSTSFLAYVQATLDTPVFASGGAGGVLPQPQPIWSLVGSSVYSIVGSSVGALTFNNLATFDNSAMFVLLQPVAGLRLASSAAGGVGSGNTVTLRALQSPTA